MHNFFSGYHSLWCIALCSLFIFLLVSVSLYLLLINQYVVGVVLFLGALVLYFIWLLGFLLVKNSKRMRSDDDEKAAH